MLCSQVSLADQSMQLAARTDRAGRLQQPCFSADSSALLLPWAGHDGNRFCLDIVSGPGQRARLSHPGFRWAENFVSTADSVVVTRPAGFVVFDLQGTHVTSVFWDPAVRGTRTPALLACAAERHQLAALESGLTRLRVYETQRWQLQSYFELGVPEDVYDPDVGIGRFVLSTSCGVMLGSYSCTSRYAAPLVLLTQQSDTWLQSSWTLLQCEPVVSPTGRWMACAFHDGSLNVYSIPDKSTHFVARVAPTPRAGLGVRIGMAWTAELGLLASVMSEFPAEKGADTLQYIQF